MLLLEAELGSWRGSGGGDVDNVQFFVSISLGLEVGLGLGRLIGFGVYITGFRWWQKLWRLVWFFFHSVSGDCAIGGWTGEERSWWMYDMDKK